VADSLPLKLSSDFPHKIPEKAFEDRVDEIHAGGLLMSEAQKRERVRGPEKAKPDSSVAHH